MMHSLLGPHPRFVANEYPKFISSSQRILKKLLYPLSVAHAVGYRSATRMHSPCRGASLSRATRPPVCTFAKACHQTRLLHRKQALLVLCAQAAAKHSQPAGLQQVLHNMRKALNIEESSKEVRRW